MPKGLKSQKLNLVEKLGVYFENEEHLSPVAARIFGYLILTGKSGATFDDIVTEIQASKSTISTGLMYLQNLNKVTYFTKTGDRKKYFIIDSSAFIKNIDERIEKWKEEKSIHFEIIAYKEMANEILRKENKVLFDTDFHHTYIAFLNSATQAISTLKDKVREKQQLFKQNNDSLNK